MVETKPKENLTYILSVRLTDTDVEVLRALGQKNGIGVATMARVLLKQKLAEE